MSRRTKLLVTAITLSGLVLVAWVFFYGPGRDKETLQDVLAREFNRPKEQIELNLPPADGRYPGTVLISPIPGQTLPIRRNFRPDEVPDVATTVTIKLDGAADAELTSRFFGSAASSSDLKLELTLTDLRLIETDLNDEFRKALLDDDEVFRASQRSANPRVVVRTYEAIISLSVDRGGSLTAEAWRETQESLVSAGGSITDRNTVSFAGNTPAVIAYETLLVDYVSDSLSAGGPDRVSLKPTLASIDFSSEQLSLDAFGIEAKSQDVAFVTMGNAKYSSRSFGNLDVVEPSREIIRDIFSKAGATPLLAAPIPDKIDESSMDIALSKISTKLDQSDTKFFVFYYVGHAVAGPGGQLYLALNDYEGNPAEDFGEDLLLGFSRAATKANSAPTSGSNLDDLLDVVVALQAEHPNEITGLFPVSDLAKRFENAGVPFAIVIDACYEHEQVDDLRDTLQLTEQGDYFGPDAWGGPQETLRLHESIQEFGTPPYLRSKNPILFSSTPGTLALTVSDPRPWWPSGEDNMRRVAPFAERFHRQFESYVARSQPITWGDFLQFTIDVRPLGEVRIWGSVSWSDFDAVKQIPMLDAR